MPQSIAINNPSTVYIRFSQQVPKKFCVYDSSGDEFYFRYMPGAAPSTRIKFRMPIYGYYTFNVPVEIVKVVPIEIPDFVRNPVLPKPQRDRWKDVTFVYN